MRRTLLLGNSKKKKKSSNPSVRKKTFCRFWLNGIVRWDFRLTQPKTERQINKHWEDQFWKFSFVYLYKTYYAKSLLRKHCKEGSNCYNLFLGYSPNSFLFLKKKHEQCRFEWHRALSSPGCAQAWEEGDFLPCNASFPLYQEPKTDKTHTH